MGATRPAVQNGHLIADTPAPRPCRQQIEKAGYAEARAYRAYRERLPG